MSWTYNSTAPGSCSMSWVRLRIGDNTSGDQQLQDEEILAMLSDVGGDQYWGAARAARSLVGKFARRMDKTVGRLRIAGQGSQHYDDLANQLEKEAALRSRPYAGGISVADKSSVVSDPDRVAPAFSIGMMDVPGSYPTSTSQMGLEPDWLTMGAVTMTWLPCTGFDVNGAPLYAAATSASAIVQSDRRVLPRPNGQTEQARALVFVFSTSASITAQDQITLPGTTDTPRILQVDKVDDENGQHHLEVLIA